VSLLAGAAFAIVHLGRPDRFLELFLRPNFASPIVWDFVAITTYLVATAMFLYLPLIPDLALSRDRRPPGTLGRRIYGALAFRWEGLPAQRRWLERGVGTIAILIIPLAVTVHSVLAWAFSMTTRPGWHSTIFAPYFVVGALYSGVALVIVAAAAFRRMYHLEAFIGARHLVPLGKVMAVLGLAYLYFTFSDLLPGAYAHTDDEVSIVGALVEGPYAVAFWIFLVGGLMAPILLVALPTRRRIGGIVAAAALAVVGMWLKRILITLPSATMPLIGDEWGAAQFTWVPALLTIGATVAIPLGMLLLFRFVPLFAVHELQEAGPQTRDGVTSATDAAAEGGEAW
jgi:molybdopterin-containing oxidoreductase family membrane subunit